MAASTWWLYGGLLVVVFINGERGEMRIFGDVSPFFFNKMFPPNRDS